MMKTKISLSSMLAIAVCVSFLAPAPKARAGSDEVGAIIVGGLIGGLLGYAIHESKDGHSRHYSRRPHRPVVVVPSRPCRPQAPVVVVPSRPCRPQAPVVIVPPRSHRPRRPVVIYSQRSSRGGRDGRTAAIYSSRNRGYARGHRRD